ncbi:glucosamine-6-phosphate deaminase [Paenibacillus sp. IB182496]|uniref:Glucosamine-6-phosphate deaminase n=1 Tax=Paenibacillus sabuli TaxID=2772509 RepID=A0A927BYM5_9BACL|nr:glucosamine-6-phosphate deaminase [Paenibacillus sabuli]MBD2847718.1 glucosamine-6-phosphate deaminase [Paenibacillus sabuli]
MQIHIVDDADQLGLQAARASAALLNEVIAEQGQARVALSTGASQFEFLKHFVTMDVPWDKVVMFHLDEYIGLSEQHPASFRNYLKERFLQHVGVTDYLLVDGEGDPAAVIARLNEAIAAAPVDLALIGIGENGHIAFNDPPADFDDPAPYRIVDLTDTCKQQQVNEGWFPSLQEVPRQAITMTVSQIMRCRRIISCVPHQAKAAAIANTLEKEISPHYPSTILKRHDDWSLYLDKASSSKIAVWA